MCSIILEAYKEGKWNVWNTMQDSIFCQASTTPDNHVYHFPGQFFYEIFWKKENNSSTSEGNSSTIEDQETKEDQLHGIHFYAHPHYVSKKGVVLCFHGNAGTIAQ